MIHLPHDYREAFVIGVITGSLATLAIGAYILAMRWLDRLGRFQEEVQEMHAADQALASPYGPRVQYPLGGLANPELPRREPLTEQDILERIRESKRKANEKSKWPRHW